MNRLKTLFFKRRHLVRPAPGPSRPFVWYSVKGAVPHATVYLVIDRRDDERSRYVIWHN
jgi:hypothetical protein